MQAAQDIAAAAAAAVACADTSYYSSHAARGALHSVKSKASHVWEVSWGHARHIYHSFITQQLGNTVLLIPAGRSWSQPWRLRPPRLARQLCA